MAVGLSAPVGEDADGTVNGDTDGTAICYILYLMPKLYYFSSFGDEYAIGCQSFGLMVYFGGE